MRGASIGWKIELELGNKQDLLEIGRQREAIGGGDKKSAAAKSGLSKNDKPDPPHNTQKIIAESLGMSTGKVAQAEKVPDMPCEKLRRIFEATPLLSFKRVGRARKPE